MTVAVMHEAYAAFLDGWCVALRRTWTVDGEVREADEVVLTLGDAMRLARVIRHPAEESGLFEDARTGRFALDADYVPCESYELHWYRDCGPDAYDSLNDTGWPEAWADEIERAVKEAMK